MACEVKTFGKISDFYKIQEFFGLSHDENFLNAVNYAISPTGELIVLALGEKIAFLSSCWNNKTQDTTYTLSWCGEIEQTDLIITAILCLPMFGKSVSSGCEWTCVALGLNSGMVTFYTDAGIKIYSQNFHDDPVLTLKCYSPPRHSEADSLFYITFNECVCLIKGNDIFPILMSCRHQMMRSLGRNSSANTTLPTDSGELVHYQKFIFSRERETLINDAIVAAGDSQRPRTYDHIIDQCLTCGYYAKATETPIQSSLVLGIGVEPYLGFYYAEEGYKTISLGEVAKGLIGSAYKNLLGGLFSRNSAAASPEELPSPSKESQMRTRTRFYDGRRDGLTIIVSSDGRLAAVTDNLDRVMLVDTQRTIVLRVWKGYRDAQCAFVPVREKTLKGVQTQRRKALFLVIYKPRMGCLEIWGLQNGPKIAAFNISKSGQLAYNTHGLLGAPIGAKTRAPVNCCLFLDPSDGSVKEILIPFHFALSESNSKTSKDIHLLRRLKNHLRNVAADCCSQSLEEISSIAGDFQTIEVRQQCLEMLKKNKQIEPIVFREIICAFDNSMTLDTTDTTDEKLNFHNLVRNYKRLTNFYIEMRTPMKSEQQLEELELNDCDLVTINQLLLLLCDKVPKTNTTPTTDVGANSSSGSGKVTFQDKCKNDGDFVDYLSIFQMDLIDRIPIQQTKSEIFGYVSGKLFGDFFANGLNFEQLKTAAQESTIPCKDLLILALHFWIEKTFTYQNCDEIIADMSRLAGMIRAICELLPDSVNDYAYNVISPWWQNVREMLLESPKSLGLLVAIVCKTVASNLRKSYKESSCEGDEISLTEEEERWEHISHDQAQWGLLIGKLEDVAILGAILETPLTSLEPVMPELPYQKPDCSLKAIVNGGKGVVTDLTAQWLVKSRIHPSKILEVSKAPAENNTTTTAAVKEDEQVSTTSSSSSLNNNVLEESKPTDPVLIKLALLREHFPFSLESGVLLSLMSWQYVVHWSKNLTNMESMHATLTCLAEFTEKDFALKHGMCSMIWSATIKFPLQSAAKLIQTMGRLPKDKYCQQEVEMSAANVADFLELTLEFLEHFASSLEHEKRELKFEENLTEGQLPLQFIALQQHHAIKDLLQIHYELCTVLHFIAFFQLKIPKPLTMVFDAIANKAFFAELNKELSYVLTAPDIVLQKQREEFLFKIITASMDLIREDLEQLYVTDHLQVMQRLIALAESWKMNTKSLYRKQIVEMYTHGYDSHGEILLKNYTMDEELGCMLLEIAGRRLSLYSEKSQTTYLKVASVGIQLLNYLDNLKAMPAHKQLQITATVYNEIDLSVLSKLVTHAFECLSQRESRSLRIAGQMFDACCMLRE